MIRPTGRSEINVKSDTNFIAINLFFIWLKCHTFSPVEYKRTSCNSCLDIFNSHGKPTKSLAIQYGYLSMSLLLSHLPVIYQGNPTLAKCSLYYRRLEDASVSIVAAEQTQATRQCVWISYTRALSQQPKSVWFQTNLHHSQCLFCKLN